MYLSLKMVLCVSGLFLLECTFKCMNKKISGLVELTVWLVLPIYEHFFCGYFSGSVKVEFGFPHEVELGDVSFWDSLEGECGLWSVAAGHFEQRSSTEVDFRETVVRGASDALTFQERSSSERE